MRSVLSIKEQNKSHWERKEEVFKGKSHLFIEIIPSSFYRINSFTNSETNFSESKWCIFHRKDIHFKVFFCKTNKQKDKRTISHKEIQSLIDVWCAGLLLWFFHEKIIQPISFQSFYHNQTNKFTNKPFWYSYFLFKQKCFLFVSVWVCVWKENINTFLILFSVVDFVSHW